MQYMATVPAMALNGMLYLIVGCFEAYINCCSKQGHHGVLQMTNVTAAFAAASSCTVGWFLVYMSPEDSKRAHLVITGPYQGATPTRALMSTSLARQTVTAKGLAYHR